ncbi:MAG TPA: carbohydrate ABC transporter permease [Candidatus Faecaligallichristensenella faecipullorum]|nr:carbohydrate ABC transporter permease [Candidatus Faecaligallichristensenella faecipullorum]
MQKQLQTRGVKIFAVVNYLVMTLLALICLLPLLHVLAVSLSDSASASANLVQFWPKGFNTASYEMVFSNQTFLNSFVISVVRTLLGTAINLAMVILAAYPLSKEESELKGRNVLIWFFTLPMLISGGLIPTFLLIKQLNLIDNLWALILPGCVPTFYVIMMMNFFRGISKSLSESASIDGASEFVIMTRIMLPLAMASIATITLFSMVNHWNEWFGGMIYMNSSEKWPLQTLLRQMLKSVDATMFSSADLMKIKQLSSRSFQSAQIIFATVPILLVYPFMQRYFISGLTIGSVKE